MQCRHAAGRRLVLLAAMWGCQGGAGDPLEDKPVTERDEEPLDFTVDRVDIIHGALRLSATMQDGSADVSISLGGACEHRDVGGGMATRSSLVWVLGADDLAGALGCDLLVEARAATATGLIFRVASLPVSGELAPSGSDEGPSPAGMSRFTSGMQLVVESPNGRERLSVGDSLIESSSVASDVPSARYAFSHRDFARAILSRRPLRLGTFSFNPSVSIGGVALEAEPPDELADGVSPSDP